jgi:hypothetical protein
MEVPWEYPGTKEKARVITSFIDSILDSKSEPIVPADDVFAAMSVCFAAESAVQEGKAASVEYI